MRHEKRTPEQEAALKEHIKRTDALAVYSWWLSSFALNRAKTSVLPTIYVAIDAGDGGSVVVSWCDATKKAAYYFAKAQLVDDGDPSNDLTLLGQTEGFSIALLALKARIGSQAVTA